MEVLRRRQHSKAILTPVPDPDLPPQSIPLEYSKGSSRHPNLKWKAISTIGTPLKQAIKMEKIAPYYSKTIQEHQDFHNSLKLAFHLELNTFANKNTKVTFTI